MKAVLLEKISNKIAITGWSLIVLFCSSSVKGTDIAIELNNNTRKSVMVSEVKTDYSYLSDYCVISGMEIEPKESLEIDICVFFDKYHTYRSSHPLSSANERSISCDKINFLLEEDNGYGNKGFTLYWDKIEGSYQPFVQPFNLEDFNLKLNQTPTRKKYICNYSLDIFHIERDVEVVSDIKRIIL